MTRRALLACLVRLAKDSDTERAHVRADDALVEYIDDQEIKVAYEAVPKWYA